MNTKSKQLYVASECTANTSCSRVYLVTSFPRRFFFLFCFSVSSPIEPLREKRRASFKSTHFFLKSNGRIRVLEIDSNFVCDFTLTFSKKLSAHSFFHPSLLFFEKKALHKMMENCSMQRRNKNGKKWTKRENKIKCMKENGKKITKTKGKNANRFYVP